jgi:hypothetical protein
MQLSIQQSLMFSVGCSIYNNSAWLRSLYTRKTASQAATSFANWPLPLHFRARTIPFSGYSLAYSPANLEAGLGARIRKWIPSLVNAETTWPLHRKFSRCKG